MIAMRKCSIDELGTVVGGATPTTKNTAFWDGGIPWLSPKDLTGRRFRYISRGSRSISDAGFKSCSAKMLPAGTVLFSSRAPIGYVAIAANPVCTNQGFKSIVPNNDVDSLFLYYLMMHNKDRIEGFSSGTTFKEVSASTMRAINVVLPESIYDQRAIATVLDALDSKIELNTRINDYLLELAAAIFERALDAGSHFITLGDLVELEDHKRIPLNKQEREARKGPFPYYGATSALDCVDDYLFDGIRLLIGEDGSVITEDGKPVLQYVWGKYWVNNHAHIMKSKSDYSLETIYVALRKTNIAHIVTGAVQAKISQRNLNGLVLEMPDMFIPDFKMIFAKIRNNEDEDMRLSSLRDVLLPKLMSGEIDVSRVDLTQLNNHLCEC